MNRLLIKSIVCFLFILQQLFFAYDLNTAERFYQNNQFEEALDTYFVYLEEQPNSFNILYNIGNCYFKLEQYGQAILYYRKALVHDHRNKDALNNLNLARSFLTVSIATEESISASIFRWFTVISFDSAYLVFLLILFLFNASVLYVMKFKKSELMINIIYSSLVLVLFSGVFVYFKYKQQSQIEAVILSKKIAVHEGPSTTLSELFFLHEGSEVFIKKDLQDWVEIELSNGFTGWVERQHLQNI